MVEDPLGEPLTAVTGLEPQLSRHLTPSGRERGSRRLYRLDRSGDRKLNRTLHQIIGVLLVRERPGRLLGGRLRLAEERADVDSMSGTGGPEFRTRVRDFPLRNKGRCG